MKTTVWICDRWRDFLFIFLHDLSHQCLTPTCHHWPARICPLPPGEFGRGGAVRQPGWKGRGWIHQDCLPHGAGTKSASSLKEPMEWVKNARSQRVLKTQWGQFQGKLTFIKCHGICMMGMITWNVFIKCVWNVSTCVLQSENAKAQISCYNHVIQIPWHFRGVMDVTKMSILSGLGQYAIGWENRSLMDNKWSECRHIFVRSGGRDEAHRIFVPTNDAGLDWVNHRHEKMLLSNAT